MTITEDNYGMTDKVKEDLINLAKQIESGPLNNDEISQAMTQEIALAIISLAKAVEDEDIDDEKLAAYLAIIMKRLGRNRDEKRRIKQKRKQKTIIDLVIENMLRSIAKERVNRKKNIQRDESQKPGFFTQQMINDLDKAIFKLVNDSRLDTDINSIRLIEDTISVVQKVAALAGKVSNSVKGMSLRLIQARTATSGQILDSSVATLSTLKQGRSIESWEEANRVDFNNIGLDTKSESQKIDADDLKKVFKITEESVSIPSGPGDVPITESTKKRKEQEYNEWANSQATLKTS